MHEIKAMVTLDELLPHGYVSAASKTLGARAYRIIKKDANIFCNTIPSSSHVNSPEKRSGLVQLVQSAGGP